ncbi:MAG: pyruvate:ferredoxin (flavodoxin) oxidoreductase [Brevinemataceae bacterium]
MPSQKISMDGNKAAAYVAYAFSEVAAIFPISPSTPMAEQCDMWSAQGQKNIFGDTVVVTEMQSEAGAVGAVHGSLQAGALTTTFTASQGLLLMIPNMYKIAGELLPAVFHVSARTVATHALSIYGDHSDVMACRQTGWGMIASSNVQDVHDYALVSHLTAIKSRVPFLHFFDGYRTSHEIQKIDVLDYSEFEKLADFDKIQEFRSRALTPDNPVTRGSAQTPDVYFQAFEARNPYYENLPSLVQEVMDQVSKVLGRNLAVVKYHGSADAERVIVIMGSVADVVRSTVDYLIAKGEKVGVINVHLYRPFPTKYFLNALPATVKAIAVLDRSKELGATGEPLYLDVCESLKDKKNPPIIVGGRYGLSSKNTTPGQIVAVFDNLAQSEPKNDFTIGIVDDVTFKSLPVKDEIDIVAPDTFECKFYGIGSDGTVGANKNSISIIGDNTDLNIQAYFDYDSKKSGGFTISHLRFGKSRIQLPYLIEYPHFVSCSLATYVYKFNMLKGLRDGGTFLLNTSWTPEEAQEKLPNHMKRYMAEHNISFYVIDANKIAREIGMRQSNTILQAAFFKLANIMPYEEAVKFMKESAKKSYSRKGDAIVEMNYKAIDSGADKIQKVEIKPEWKDLSGDFELTFPDNAPDFVKNIAASVNQLQGDELPVSAFATDWVDGTLPAGTTQFEKRAISDIVPEWIEENCIQCNQCAFVCPHAVIRPFLIDGDEAASMSPNIATLPAVGADSLKYAISVSVADCTGCSACVDICPGKGGKKALSMENIETQNHEQANYDWLFQNCKPKNPFGKNNAKAVQFEQPLFEFHAACPGCGETPYIKLVTQLFGDRMMIANTTGCTSIYGAASPSTPYTSNKEGHGPTWANSLFEDNAEFGFGMHIARKKLRARLVRFVEQALSEKVLSNPVVFEEWMQYKDDSEKTREVTTKVQEALKQETHPLAQKIKDFKDYLVMPSTWLFGGDGWAYDIGFGGLDHVLANHENINVLVLDTEVYSNTGGQASKSTPMAAQALFAYSGKENRKKNLGLMMSTYGHIYVAQISMGANKAHALKVMQEAEAYPGPSLIIAYSPCIAHGLKGGLTNAQSEEKLAVDSGYWHLWRYNPVLEQEGKNPFVLDSPEPKFELFQQFIGHEIRFSALGRSFPERAQMLFTHAEEQAKLLYKHYKRLANMNFGE